MDITSLVTKEAKKGVMQGIWKSLTLSTKESAYAIASSLRLRYHDAGGGNLIYKNNRAYKSVFAHSVKQTAMQAAEAELNKLFPRYQKYIEDKIRKPIVEKLPTTTSIIKDGVAIDNKYGKIQTKEGNDIYAKDRYGQLIKEALIISYDTDYQISVTDPNNPAHSFKTSTMFFIDLAPNVSVQNGKNLVLTPVQGRDFTRKELIAGGDIAFNVSGMIVSDDIYKYPENEVQKFIQLMQYGGVLKVNHFLFGQFNVTQMLVKEFSLSHPECPNMQPYSFSCVAVEKDQEVIVTQDTLGVLNKEIALSPEDKKYKLLLNNRLIKIAANATTDFATSATGATLDTLIPNI